MSHFRHFYFTNFEWISSDFRPFVKYFSFCPNLGYFRQVLTNFRQISSHLDKLWVALDIFFKINFGWFSSHFRQILTHSWQLFLISSKFQVILDKFGQIMNWFQVILTNYESLWTFFINSGWVSSHFRPILTNFFLSIITVSDNFVYICLCIYISANFFLYLGFTDLYLYIVKNIYWKK